MDKKSKNDSSSETSSYQSASEVLTGKMNINGVEMELGDLSEDEEDLQALMMDDGETPGHNSYARFKT